MKENKTITRAFSPSHINKGYCRTPQGANAVHMRVSMCVRDSQRFQPVIMERQLVVTMATKSGKPKSKVRA